MNFKEHWLKSLAVAAVVAMASANASAEIVAAVTANGHFELQGTPINNVPGMATSAFAHSGGQLVATYSAECYAAEGPPYSNTNSVTVAIVVFDTAGNQVAMLSPANFTSAFCSAGGGPGTFSITGVGTLPRGTYRVQVRGRLTEQRLTGWMGARSLVVSR